MKLEPSELASIGVYIPMSLLAASGKRVPEWMILAATLMTLGEAGRIIHKLRTPETPPRLAPAGDNTQTIHGYCSCK